MSTASASLPCLPLEVKGHVLRFCDVQTLGRTSRVSLAFLELSGPVLYRDITVKGKRQLEKLFQSETALPSIAAFVSLAQTRRFTYVCLDDEDDTEHDIPRPLAASRIPIDELVVDAQYLPASRMDYDDIWVPELLATFSPCCLQLVAVPGPEGRVGRYHHLPMGLRWTHLRLITFKNTLSRPSLADLVDLVVHSHSLDVVVDFRSQDASRGQLKLDLSDLRSDFDGEGYAMGAMLEFGHVQVWVNGEDEVALAKEHFEGCRCNELDIGIQEIEDA